MGIRLISTHFIVAYMVNQRGSAAEAALPAQHGHGGGGGGRHKPTEAPPRLRRIAGDAQGHHRCLRRTGAHRGEQAARAAANITDDQVRELESIQSQLESAYAGDDHERAVRLNHDFHRAINVTADSPKLSQLMSQITRYAPNRVSGLDGWPKRSMKDHRRVVAALAKRDAEQARSRCPIICRRAQCR